MQGCLPARAEPTQPLSECLCCKLQAQDPYIRQCLRVGVSQRQQLLPASEEVRGSAPAISSCFSTEVFMEGPGRRSVPSAIFQTALCNYPFFPEGFYRYFLYLECTT